MSALRWWPLLGLVLLLVACATGREGPSEPSGASRTASASASAVGPPAAGPAASPAPGSADPWAVSAPPGRPALPAPAPPDELTVPQLAGQRVVYSYPGPTPPPELLEEIRQGRAAGVIFFAENIAAPEQFGQAVAQLRQAQRESPVHLPLLLMTDQEGGAVRRLPGGPALSERQVGQAADPVAAAALAGREAGENLAGFGLNVNLAPVLDVYDRPGDFIDRSGRSYGQHPAAVAALGQAFIRAQQATGVAATAKHFPGLGTAPAGADTDAEPVALPIPAAALRERDEAPYPAAIAAGVQLVMVSWAVYPALDPDHPAGLSPTVVGGELRERLGYGGVTITDALEAGGLAGVGDTGQRAVAAAAAGMDLLLCSARDVEQGRQAVAALAAALTAGQLDGAGFGAAVDRVTALRAGLR